MPGETETQQADEVDLLLDQLKALPLIEMADLDKPFAAFDAFELVTSAILRAALVQVPEHKRKGNNGQLFKQFVAEHFPAGRGRGDEAYAEALWKFRCSFVKDKQTDGFILIHNRPDVHLAKTAAGPLLNLQSLVADFRDAVDNLGGLLRTSSELREVARAELAKRQVRIIEVTVEII